MSITGTYAGKDGLNLFYRHWRPSTGLGDARAGLVIIHGAAEHSGRYEHFGTRYAEKKNYAVWAPDLPGLGRSDGRRGHIEHFEDYLDAVGRMVDMARAALPERRIFLVGFSLGGLIALKFAEDRQRSVDGVAVSGPLLKLKVEIPPLKAAAAPVLAKILPRLALANELDPAVLAHNQTVGAEYMADPLLVTKVTPRWFAELNRAMEETKRNASALAGLPLLIMQAGADEVVDPAATRAFAVPGREYVEFPGFYHELFNEDERGQAFAVLDGWLERRLQ